MEDGSTAAQHAAEHTAEDTEDGTAGVRNEGAGSATATVVAAVRTWAVHRASLSRRQHEQMARRWVKRGRKEWPQPQWRMTDTGTAGTAEREVRAGACSAEGRGMDASDGFVIFERTAISELGAVDMAGDGLGMAATGGCEGTGARAAAIVRANEATDGVIVGNGDRDGSGMVDEGTRLMATRGVRAHGDAPLPNRAEGAEPARRKRPRSSNRPRAKKNRRDMAAFNAARATETAAAGAAEDERVCTDEEAYLWRGGRREEPWVRVGWALPLVETGEHPPLPW